MIYNKFILLYINIIIIINGFNLNHNNIYYNFNLLSYNNTNNKLLGISNKRSINNYDYEHLLYKIGIISKLTSGIYTILPIGKRIINRIKRIIDIEMYKLNAQEIILPLLQPQSLINNNNKLNLFNNELYKLNDHNNNTFFLSPTCEELIIYLLQHELYPISKSILPIILYQFNTKFRDEIRTSNINTRYKEFIMKDAYSFHSDPTDANLYYNKFINTYTYIFNLLGIKFNINHHNNNTEFITNIHTNNINTHKSLVSHFTSYTHENIPHEVQSNSLPPEVTTSVPLAVEASSNYLPVNGNATPGDRGGREGSDGSSIMGMMEDGSKDVFDVTSSGLPVADLREAEGQLNREGSLQEEDKVVTSGGNELISMEIGHIFRFGEIDLSYEMTGRREYGIYMNSYGIGINRLLSAIIYNNIDDNGIRLPQIISPWDVCIIPCDDSSIKMGECVRNYLSKIGLSVLLDDRNLSINMRLMDMKLIGVSHILTFSKIFKDRNIHMMDDDIFNRLKYNSSISNLYNLGQNVDRFSCKDVIDINDLLDYKFEYHDRLHDGTYIINFKLLLNILNI